MSSISLPLDQRWKEALALTHRVPPDLFEPEKKIGEAPYGPAVRIGLDDLGLSAIFCVHNVPTVAIRRAKEYNPSSIRTIRSALWNQGLASILINITEDTNEVHIYSLFQSRPPEEGDLSNDRSLIHTFDTSTSAIAQYISGAESGRIWQEYPDYFHLGERIDAVMLNNLKVGHHRLLDWGLSSEQAEAALMQTMFIAYLEDRAIINEDYFRSATESQYKTWSELLAAGDISAMERVFRQLRADFNGDLFVAPCSFLDAETDAPLTPEHLQLLMRFRKGEEELSKLGHDQLRLWGYDFRYISVELISEVYDNFLHSIPNHQKNLGTYYTPAFLADQVVSTTWSLLSESNKSKAIFLDPACGSGIFLIKTFQRLCQYLRESDSRSDVLTWCQLVKTLHRVRGQDINRTAVQIAAFSLYLALLEQLSPIDCQNLHARGDQLPNLWKNTLQSRDFFDPESSDFHADIIIGNPPWTRILSNHKKTTTWIKKHDYQVPGKAAAWAFVWKSIDQLKNGGILSFVLPATGFLHNQAPSSLAARSRLFREVQVRAVVDFSDLRRTLASHAIRPASLIIMSKPRENHSGSYLFDYLAPKATPNLFHKRFIEVSNEDRVQVKSADVEQNSLLLKQRFRIKKAEIPLFQYLANLPCIGNTVKPSSHTKSTTNWAIGRGFGKSSISQKREIGVLSEIPFLPVEKFSPLKFQADDLERRPGVHVLRTGFQSGFKGNRVLVRRDIRDMNGRLCAAFVSTPVSFEHIIMAITVPEGEEDTAKLMTAILNSRLSSWFAFHGTSRLGIERSEVGLNELLTLPFPSPTDLGDPTSAGMHRRALIDKIDRFSPDSDHDITAEVLCEIDQLTYQYFGLSEDEISLIEESAKFVIPASQPKGKDFLKIWYPATKEQRRSYAGTLAKRLSGWFVDQRLPSVRLAARNQDYAIIELSISPGARTQAYTEENLREFPHMLVDISRNVAGPIIGNFMVTPDIRVFDGNKLYLIKPLQLRYWLRAAALGDADAIALDLEELWHTGQKGSVVS